MTGAVIHFQQPPRISDILLYSSHCHSRLMVFWMVFHYARANTVFHTSPNGVHPHCGHCTSTNCTRSVQLVMENNFLAKLSFKIPRSRDVPTELMGVARHRDRRSERDTPLRTRREKIQLLLQNPMRRRRSSSVSAAHVGIDNIMERKRERTKLWSTDSTRTTTTEGNLCSSVHVKGGVHESTRDE